MSTAQARLEFAPPPTPGLVRAMALAVVAHGLLLAVLAVGLRWQHDAPIVAVEAELWSALPVLAAPPPAPAPPPEPALPPEPVRPIVAPPPAPPAPDPAIAIEKEKVRQRELKLQQERQELQKREALRAKQAKEEKEAREKEARDKAQREKLAREKKLQEDQKRADAAKTAAESKKLAELRQQQLDRIARMAGQATGNGDTNSTGTAARSSGPSASYAGRIAARVKPNITYTDPILGNPSADVEVRTSLDGTIISRRLVKSSGVKSWDDAVLAAIDKTEKIPPDVDGRVIPSLTLGFRPRD